MIPPSIARETLLTLGRKIRLQHEPLIRLALREPVKALRRVALPAPRGLADAQVAAQGVGALPVGALGLVANRNPKDSGL